jgi:methylglutamate dehydrogenase subunit D
VPEANVVWVPRGAWAGILEPGSSEPSAVQAGVTVTPLEGLSAASLLVRADARQAFAALLSDRFGLDLPGGPRVGRGSDFQLVWSGPDQWLALARQRSFLERLAAECGDLAAVSDQSDARAILRVGGAHVRDALAKGCTVDLHPRAFRTGDVAVTSIAHIGVQLWQDSDAPTFCIACFRSLAASFWSWLSSSGAEFGVAVIEPPALDA